MSSDADRFWTKVARGNAEECWPFTGSRDRHGYGSVRWRGRARRAHRVALELATGADPGELDVLHSCDNPPCCNPSHLRTGTAADNARDMDSRGRRVTRTRVGEANNKAKLTAEIVVEVRRLAAAGTTHRALARRFGVSRPAISYVVRGDTWKHIGETSCG